MADETRPGWELLYEDGKPATDENWGNRLAANDSTTMDLELKWKPLQLLPQTGSSSAPQVAFSTSQNSLSPFGVTYPGYGNSSYGGAGMMDKEVKLQSKT